MTKKAGKVLSKDEMGTLVHNTPYMVHKIYEGVRQEKGGKGIPRQASVLKRYKEEMQGVLGIPFQEMVEKDQRQLLEMVSDTYVGIRG